MFSISVYLSCAGTSRLDYCFAISFEIKKCEFFNFFLYYLSFFLPACLPLPPPSLHPSFLLSLTLSLFFFLSFFLCFLNPLCYTYEVLSQLGNFQESWNFSKVSTGIALNLQLSLEFFSYNKIKSLSPKHDICSYFFHIPFIVSQLWCLVFIMHI